MVREAEAHAEEDRRRRELVDFRNQADAAIYGAEKALKDAEGRLPADVKGDIDGAISALRAVMQRDQAQPIRDGIERLRRASMRIGEALNRAGEGSGGQGSGGTDNSDVIDAEFREVDDDHRKASGGRFSPRALLPSRSCKEDNPMAHDDQDDKVHLAGEGLSADSQEPVAVEAANASPRDRLLRALAEVENTRRLAERRVADAREHGISDFAAELLSVVDNLQRAVASAEDRTDQTPADAALLDGVRATQRQLLATLGRFGVKRIEALGASFDPNLHEAMAEVEDDSRPPRSVVSVLEDGYMIHDRLLRAARVAVAKRRLEAAPPVDAAWGA